MMLNENIIKQRLEEAKDEDSNFLNYEFHKGEIIVQYKEVPRLDSKTGQGVRLSRIMYQHDLTITQIKPRVFEGVKIWME